MAAPLLVAGGLDAAKLIGVCGVVGVDRSAVEGQERADRLAVQQRGVQAGDLGAGVDRERRLARRDGEGNCRPPWLVKAPAGPAPPLPASIAGAEALELITRMPRAVVPELVLAIFSRLSLLDPVSVLAALTLLVLPRLNTAPTPTPARADVALNVSIEVTAPSATPLRNVSFMALPLRSLVPGMARLYVRPSLTGPLPTKIPPPTAVAAIPNGACRAAWLTPLVPRAKNARRSTAGHSTGSLQLQPPSHAHVRRHALGVLGVVLTLAVGFSLMVP